MHLTLHGLWKPLGEPQDIQRDANVDLIAEDLSAREFGLKLLGLQYAHISEIAKIYCKIGTSAIFNASSALQEEATSRLHSVRSHSLLDSGGRTAEKRGLPLRLPSKEAAEQ